jgi:hypothetical protein
MELIIDDLKYTMPPLDAPVPRNPLLRARFFGPSFGDAYYPVKFDGDNIFWGLIDDGERTLDYFRLSDLERPSSDLTLADIQRDMRFVPCRAGELPPWTERDPLYQEGTVRVEVATRPDGGLDIVLIEFGWASTHAGFVRFPTEVFDRLRTQLDSVAQALANKTVISEPVEVTWDFAVECG